MTRREFGKLAATGLPMISASLAAGDDAIEGYFDAANQHLCRIRSESAGQIGRVGRRLAGRVAGGGRLFVFDSRGGYVSEALGRAGGLMAIAPLPADAAGVTANDAVIVVADDRLDAAAVAAAEAARAAGALVTGIGPASDTGKSLEAACHATIANTLDGGAGNPLSGVLNTAILWALIAAYIEAMEARGRPPHIWMSIKRPGSKAFNDAALAETAKVGY